LLGRNEEKLRKHFPKQAQIITWDKLKNFPMQKFCELDCIINLAGANIGAKRWSAKRKQAILNSRVEATKAIASLCKALGPNSPRLLNASAIGIYGLQKSIQKQNEIIYNEDSKLPHPASDFLSTVGQAWEAALEPAIQAGVPVCVMRFAVVLAKQGGALAKMLPSFKLGFGAILGTGKQPFSWISLQDLVRAIDFIVQRPEIVGPVNLVADEIVSQRQFAKQLAKALKRPCWLAMPAFMVKLLFGEMGKALLLNGQRVKGDKLKKENFVLQYPKLDRALTEIFKK
jgi:uncharacterized protein (TIGR01777 family)